MPVRTCYGRGGRGGPKRALSNPQRQAPSRKRTRGNKDGDVTSEEDPHSNTEETPVNVPEMAELLEVVFAQNPRLHPEDPWPTEEEDVSDDEDENEEEEFDPEDEAQAAAAGLMSLCGAAPARTPVVWKSSGEGEFTDKRVVVMGHSLPYNTWTKCESLYHMLCCWMQRPSLVNWKPKPETVDELERLDRNPTVEIGGTKDEIGADSKEEINEGSKEETEKSNNELADEKKILAAQPPSVPLLENIEIVVDEPEQSIPTGIGGNEDKEEKINGLEGPQTIACSATPPPSSPSISSIPTASADQVSVTSLPGGGSVQMAVHDLLRSGIIVAADDEAKMKERIENNINGKAQPQYSCQTLLRSLVRSSKEARQRHQREFKHRITETQRQLKRIVRGYTQLQQQRQQMEKEEQDKNAENETGSSEEDESAGDDGNPGAGTTTDSSSTNNATTAAEADDIK